MADFDNMSPEASPGGANRKAGVRRVNNVPMYIVGGLLLMFLIIMATVAWDRAKQQSRIREPKEEVAGSTAAFANELAGNHKDGFIQAVKAAPPDLPPPDTLPLPAQSDAMVPPQDAPAAVSQQVSPAANDERQRIRASKLHQFEEAIHAKTRIQVAAPQSGGAAAAGPSDGRLYGTFGSASAAMAPIRVSGDGATNDDPNLAYLARMQRLRNIDQGGNASGGETAGSGLTQSPNAQSANGKDYGQFGLAPQNDRWRLDSRPEAPRSPYELRAGFIVPALLISGINSDLPGQIMAQVSQDVFDTPTGKWKLIPQGARLVGQYSSDVAYGQARILIAWQRIVFPDGKAMDIGAMPGADSAGYAGFSDQVNNHYARLFGSAFLMSGVTAGVALSQPQTVSLDRRQSAGSAMSEALGQQLGQVTGQLIAKNMNIAPTLEIRPGYRFNVIVTKDLTFSKPYQPFDY